MKRVRRKETNEILRVGRAEVERASRTQRVCFVRTTFEFLLINENETNYRDTFWRFRVFPSAIINGVPVTITCTLRIPYNEQTNENQKRVCNSFAKRNIKRKRTVFTAPHSWAIVVLCDFRCYNYALSGCYTVDVRWTPVRLGSTCPVRRTNETNTSIRVFRREIKSHSVGRAVLR